MNFFIFLILFLVLIELITMIHEAGHLWIAKKNGVRVAEFSIGFGPAIFQIRRKNTTYSLRWLPLGGYVSVLSENLIQEIEKVRRLKPNQNQIRAIEKKMAGLKIYEDYSFQKPIEKIKTSQRLIFTLGGVMFNFFSIFCTLLIAYSLYGKSYRQDAILLNISNDKGQKESALVIEDIVYQKNDNSKERINTYDQMSYFLSDPEEYDDQLEWISVEIPESDMSDKYQTSFISKTQDFPNTSNLELNFSITNFYGLYVDDQGQSKTNDGVLIIPKDIELLIFISYNPEAPIAEQNAMIMSTEGAKPNSFIEYSELQTLTGFKLFYSAFADSFIYLGYSFLWLLNFITFGAIFNALNIHLAGTIMVAPFLIFMRKWMIIMIASSGLLIVFNILPIPPLDGWQTFETSYEKIKKRKISQQTQKTIMRLGWSLLFMIFFIGLFV